MTGVELSEFEVDLIVVATALFGWAPQAEAIEAVQKVTAQIVAVRLAAVEAERWALNNQAMAEIARLTAERDAAQDSSTDLSYRLQAADARAAKFEALVEAGLGLADEWGQLANLASGTVAVPIALRAHADELRAALGGAGEEATEWPICTKHAAGRHGHVGNEDHTNAETRRRYVSKRGDATCSCCDPGAGFPCTAGWAS